MVFSFYGNYFFLLKEVESGDNGSQANKSVSLADFLEKKPQLADQIMGKIDKVASKLVEKGMIRHTLVQAILYDLFK